MNEIENILISLDHRHAQNIYTGTKKVELRRRPLQVRIGDIVWIYEKVPIGSITGKATIKAIHNAKPKSIWSQFGSVSGLSKTEFFEYFVDRNLACALVLSQVQKLQKPLTLAELRNSFHNFQPPQFFLRLQTKESILETLLDSHPYDSNILDSSFSLAD